ncbi:uncharacterized protein LOC124367384 isoform X3 [Homalodisca vitripennis]|uniref:uncharacterized protein LOC124367384 isoform X3 n=1 Tax=Homalodisca vitripennis TaxID=197043 RepID=UPI001EECC770|nr:uncharacterized protein LOC124367384 isoform X3 [Homalodisca vitripennis]
MFSTKEHNDQGFISDSTVACSSTSIDLCKRSRKCFDCHFQKSVVSSRTKHSPSKCSKPHLSYKAGRRPSLLQCMEKQSQFKKKSKLSHINTCSSPVRYDYKSPQMCWTSDSPTSGHGGKGDSLARNNPGNQVQVIYPVMATQTPSQEHDSFPFKPTPSGNYKLKPSQVVYESKNLSIVAADPGSVMLNVTESNKTVETDFVNRPEKENWDTTFLYTSVGADGKLPFGSELSDTISDSDGGFINHKSSDKPSEISLAKMGYVVDNCLDWKNLILPKKADLQKLLLHNVLNKIHPDIQVKIGSSVYNCHRIVLQCYCSNFIPKSGSVVELPEKEVSKDVFSQIYHWMLHLGTDSYKLLRRDNILEIYKAASFLKIKELEDQCWAFIDNVDVFFEDRAFLLYLAARKYDNKTVMELMIPRVQRFFLTLVSSREFVEFSCEEVCTFLQSNYICIHCEMEVFMAGVRWLEHDWNRRKEHAVEVMSCVRFGFINPRVLITLRRNPQSPQFLRVANIPEISKMIDDGVALSILKTYFENDSDEDFQKSLKLLGVTNPVPRNWAGSDKNYQTYDEFMQELNHYRSKQRLDVKLSRMKLKLESVNDDFLSSAVLPPATHQKITQMAGGSALIRCLPQLEPKELELLKKMICQDGTLVENKGKKMKSKLCAMAEEEYKQKPCRKSKDVRKARRLTPAIVMNPDEAAKKIQKAYRHYHRRKSGSLVGVTEGIMSSGGHVTKNMKSMSDPSLPSYLMKSSVLTTGEEDVCCIPLHFCKESLFVFGGVNPFEDVNYCNSGSKIYQYMSRSNCWQVYGEMPEPRHYHCVLFFQGWIFVAGGKHTAKETNDPGAISRKVWRFNPTYKNWSSLRDMRHPRRSFGFVACNNRLFALGGRDDQDRILNQVEMYDAVAEKWVEVQPMNEARAGLAVSEYNGRIWVAGGLLNSANIATKSVEYYNVQQNTWTQVSSLRYTLAYGVMVPMEGRLYLVGGAIGLQDMPSSGSGRQIDVWDHDNQNWALATMMCKPRHAHAAVCLKGDTPHSAYCMVLGGMSTKHNSALDKVECWNVQDNQWIPGIAQLPQPLAGHVALALPSHVMG